MHILNKIPKGFLIILHNLFLVDKVLNAYYVKLLAPPTIIHPLYSKKNKNGTVH